MNFVPQPILTLAIRAGQEALRLRREGLTVSIKPDRSKVTNADLAADKIITAGLKYLHPETPIISEEDPNKPANGAYDSGWIVDPIDGTTGFIRGDKEWGVLIGYVENGVPIHGVAYYPELNQAFFTSGARAYKRSVDVGADGSFRLGVPIELKVKETPGKPLSYGQFITDIRPRFPDDAQNTSYVEPSNSIAVINGSIDLATNPHTMGDWDLAAPDAILRKAGGAFVSTATGQLLEYGKPRSPDRAYLLDESVAGHLATLQRIGLADEQIGAVRSVG